MVIEHTCTTRTQFATLDEARYQIYNLIQKYRQVTSCHPTVGSKRKAREDCAIGLLSWGCKFAEYVKTMRRHTIPIAEIVAAALHTYRDIGCLLLLVHSHEDLAVGFDTSQEFEIQAMRTINSHFVRTKDRIENLEGSNGFYGNHERRPFVVVDSGTFHPYLRRNRRLGSTNLRHQLLSMIGNGLSDHLAWQNRGAYSVAEKFANVEEGLVFALSAPEPRFQPVAMHVVLYMEERQLLRRQCVTDPTDGALVWTQEWYTF